MDYFREKEVWMIRKVNEALRRTGRPPITVRWVEVNKGDDANPKFRSRLVAREIRMKDEEAIFAPTPPLESLRMVLSHATTQFPNEKTKVWDGESPDRQMIYFMDISRAYFNAKVDESDPVYVDLPPGPAHPGMCAMLQRHVWHAPSGGWMAIRVQRFTGGVWIYPRDVIRVCVRACRAGHYGECAW